MTEDPDPSAGSMPTKQTKGAEAEIMVLHQDSGWKSLGFDVETVCREAASSTLSAAEADDGALEISIEANPDKA